MSLDRRLPNSGGRILADVQQRLLRVEQRLYPQQEKNEPATPPVAGLGFNPTLVLWDPINTSTVSGGIGRGMKMNSYAYVDTPAYLSAYNTTNYTQVENVADEMLWLQVSAMVLWDGAGSSAGRRGLYINKTGTAYNELIYDNVSAAGNSGAVPLAHAASGVMVLEPGDYLYGEVVIDGAPSAQTFTDMKLDVVVLNKGAPTEGTFTDPI